MNPVRRRVAIYLALAATAGLTACGGSQTGGSGPAAEVPTYHVGDRWVYSGTDGYFRLFTNWEETHTISSIGAEGIGERVTVKGPTLDLARIEQWSAPGIVKVGSLYENETRQFATPLDRYRFPLASGETWSQFVNNYDEATKATGQINRYVRVGGWEKVTTPAGTFDTIVLHVSMWLDDETFWRFPTQCTYIVWYAPSVRGVVKELKRATYQEKGGDMDSGARVPTQNTVLELVSFTPGA